MKGRTIKEISTASYLSHRVRYGFALSSRETTRKGMVALVDQSVYSGTNFLTGAIIARASTKEEFGLYILGFSILYFAIVLQNSLISMPYMVYSPRLGGGPHARYAGSALFHQLTLSALFVFALSVGSLTLSLGLGPRGFASVIRTLVVVITFIMLREFVRRICFVTLRTRTALLLDSCVAVVQISGLLLFAYLRLLSASLAYSVIGVSCGINALIWLISNRKTFNVRVKQVIPDLRRNWRLAKWVFGSELLNIVSMNFYPWILTTWLGTAAAGVWAACLGAASIGNPLVLGIQNFLGPKLSYSYKEDGTKALRRVLFKATTVICFAMGVFCIVILLFGGSLVVLIYGEKYSGNGLVTSIIALGLLPCLVATFLSQALFVIERADIDFIVNIVSPLILGTFGIWMVASYGIIGAAHALLISGVVTSGVRYGAFTILTRSEKGKKYISPIIHI